MSELIDYFCKEKLSMYAVLVMGIGIFAYVFLCNYIINKWYEEETKGE